MSSSKLVFILCSNVSSRCCGGLAIYARLARGCGCEGAQVLLQHFRTVRLQHLNKELLN